MRKLMVLCTMLVFSAVTVVSAQTVTKKTDMAPQQGLTKAALKTAPGVKIVTNPNSPTHINPGTISGQNSSTAVKPPANAAAKQSSAVTVKQQTAGTKVQSSKTGTLQPVAQGAALKTKSAPATLTLKKAGEHAPEITDPNFKTKFDEWRTNYPAEHKAYVKSLQNVKPQSVR